MKLDMAISLESIHEFGNIPKDKYYAEVFFGEDTRHDIAVVYLTGSEYKIKIDFIVCDYYAITSGHLLHSIKQHKPVDVVLCQIENSSMVDDVYRRASGFADHFDLRHYRVFAENCIIDIVSDYLPNDIKIESFLTSDSEKNYVSLPCNMLPKDNYITRTLLRNDNQLDIRLISKTSEFNIHFEQLHCYEYIYEGWFMEDYYGYFEEKSKVVLSGVPESIIYCIKDENLIKQLKNYLDDFGDYKHYIIVSVNVIMSVIAKKISIHEIKYGKELLSLS